MSNQRESKLDKFAKELDQWLTPKKLGGDGIKFAQAASRLSEHGCSVAASTIYEWWIKRQDAKEAREMLMLIATGGKQLQQVEDALKRSPVPEMDALLKLFRVLILQLSTQGKANPQLLVLADRMTNTVMEFISGQTKAKFKEREVSLAERKAADAKKTEQEKALEFCLDEAKEFPKVQDLFKQAFAALKAAAAK
jgi:hypothetical protein